MQIGFMFGIDDARVCRIIKRLEPFIARIVGIKKNRSIILQRNGVTRRCYRTSHRKGQAKSKRLIFQGRRGLL